MRVMLPHLPFDSFLVSKYIHFRRDYSFCWHGLPPLVPFEGRLQINAAPMTDHLYPMLKHFSSDGRGLFEDNTVPSTGQKGLLNDDLMMMKMSINNM